MYALVGYNKDRDTFSILCYFNSINEIQKIVSFCRKLLENGSLRDETGEAFDWLEVWKDEKRYLVI